MKTRTFLFFCVFLTSVMAFSQDWQSVRSGGEYYFTSPSKEKKAIRIDSIVTTGNLQYYYNFPTIRSTGDYVTCYTAYGDSWIGRYVACDQAGMNYFFNYNHDTIRLKTKAVQNETWDFYEFDNGNMVEARVTAVSNVTFLGLTDSVKTISLQVKDPVGNPLNNYLNSYELKLSKHYGLIKLLNLQIFPDSNSIYWQYPPNELQYQFNICGMTNPQTGKTNLTFDDVFDFQPGDEFHTTHTYFSWQPPGQIDTTFTIKRVLARINYPGNDSVKYVFERIQKKIIFGQPSSQIIYTWDTITDVVDFNEPLVNSLIKLPGEVVRGFYGSNDVIVMLMNEYCNGRSSKTIPSWDGIFLESYPNDSCLQHIIGEGCLPELTYIEGCGGPYYQCDGVIIREENELLFYKKGTEQCGTPLDPGVLLAMNEPDLRTGLRVIVYPNPAILSFTIKIENGVDFPYKLEISSVLGKMLMKKSIQESTTKISVEGFPTGIYIYKILNGETVESSGKLVVN